MRGVGETEINQFGKEHAMFVVLGPEIPPRQLMFPKFLEQPSFTIPLVVVGHVHPIPKNQSEDYEGGNRGQDNQAQPGPVESTSNRFRRHVGKRQSSGPVVSRGGARSLSARA